MDKAIKKITGEQSYFLGNVLVGVRVAFLPECPLVLSHLWWGFFFLQKKNCFYFDNLIYKCFFLLKNESNL